jgi:hypothetical protein
LTSIKVVKERPMRSDCKFYKTVNFLFVSINNQPVVVVKCSDVDEDLFSALPSLSAHLEQLPSAKSKNKQL